MVGTFVGTACRFDGIGGKGTRGMRAQGRAGNEVSDIITGHLWGMSLLIKPVIDQRNTTGLRVILYALPPSMNPGGKVTRENLSLFW